MSTAFRYLIVIVTGLLLILGPIAWAIQFKHSFRAKMARLVREHEVAQGNVAAANLSDDEILKDGFGAELPPGTVFQLTIADILFQFWWVWCLFVLALCCCLSVGLGYFTVCHRPASVPDSSP